MCYCVYVKHEVLCPYEVGSRNSQSSNTCSIRIRAAALDLWLSLFKIPATWRPKWSSSVSSCLSILLSAFSCKWSSIAESTSSLVDFFRFGGGCSVSSYARDCGDGKSFVVELKHKSLVYEGPWELYAFTAAHVMFPLLQLILCHCLVQFHHGEHLCQSCSRDHNNIHTSRIITYLR